MTNLKRESKIAESAKAEVLKWAERQGIDIHSVHLVGLFFEGDTRLGVWVFYRADEEISRYAGDETSDQVSQQFISVLRDHSYPEELVSQMGFQFDSDENVQKNYEGSYFYRLR